ncbi:MAG: hypothetical protein LPD71_04380 [Shewanella sp.]|nr:hypothetical protein [Shewanella sp.]MCF1429611.1 hypothetical protein [Shewanella sp.]MCF1438002.1 hypothetical protein [Shewanella sp.]MCF1458390.1 hypothetical protein [Shewanella sp.]
MKVVAESGMLRLVLLTVKVNVAGTQVRFMNIRLSYETGMALPVNNYFEKHRLRHSGIGSGVTDSATLGEA